MDSHIIISENGRQIKLPAKVFQNVQGLKPLLSETCWKVYGELARKPSYPAEIAKKLQIHEQKVYYYINQLKKAGLVSVKRTEEKQGALAKYYSANFESFALVPDISLAEKKEFVFSEGKGKKLSAHIAEFLSPFIHNGTVNAKIIVGSPDPHGPNKARARDQHLAAELAAFLCCFAERFQYPLVLLDTTAPSIEHFDENLIIIGGPITNKLAKELNEKLPIRFVSDGAPSLIHSDASGRDYLEDSVGMIVKIQHPSFKARKILLIAGNRNAGTQAAIIALIKNLDAVMRGNLFDEKLEAKVVEGLDLDGDGQIDNAEVKE